MKSLVLQEHRFEGENWVGRNTGFRGRVVMNQHKSIYRKADLIILSIFGLDIIFCTVILTLLAMALAPSNLQAHIFANEYVERISIISSSIGFLMAAILLLRILYTKSSFHGILLLLKPCLFAGLFHFICALALIFFYATSWGLLPIVVGYLYREYGYVQLINAVIYFGIFFYFMGFPSPSTNNGQAVHDE